MIDNLSEIIYDQDQYEYLTRLQNEISFYSCWIILIIGLISNTLNIIICMRKRIQREAIGFYSPLMSIFNVTSLVYGFFTFYKSTRMYYLESTLNCTLFFYLGRITYQMSSWLYVMCSLDRMICITYPRKYKLFKKRHILTLTVLGLFMTICLLNIPNLFYQVIDNTSKNETKLCTPSSPFVILIRDTIALLMRTALPIVLEFFINISLIYKLIKSRRNLNLKRSLRRDYKFAFTIVMLNVMFLITNVPFFVTCLYSMAMGYERVDVNSIFKLRYGYVSFWLFLTAIVSSYMFVSVFFVNMMFCRFFKIEFFKAFHETILNSKRILTKLKFLFHRLASFSFRQNNYSPNLNQINLNKDVGCVVLVRFRASVDEIFISYL